jgi:hypothetical protein
MVACPEGVVLEAALAWYPPTGMVETGAEAEVEAKVEGEVAKF